MGTGQVDR
jgi:hypothetical protein